MRAKLLSTAQGEGWSSGSSNFAYNPDGSTSTSMLKCQITLTRLILSFLRLASEKLPCFWGLRSCVSSSKRLCMASQVLRICFPASVTRLPFPPSPIKDCSTRKSSCKTFTDSLRQYLKARCLIFLKRDALQTRVHQNNKVITA